MNNTNPQENAYNYARFDTTVYGIGPFERAPRVGECAPDFEVETLAGERVKLSDFRGRRVVLETGSLTCPMFGGNIEGMNAIAQQFGEEDTVCLVLYTREAHPGAKTPAHGSMAAKRDAAARVGAMLADNRLLLVDTVDGDVHRQWGEFPNSVWIIDRAGVVRFRSDWNRPGMVAQLLASEPIESHALALREHNKPGLDSLVHVIKWLIAKAGWRSLWDMVSQPLGLAARHREVDEFYRGKQYLPTRAERSGGCM